MGITRTLLDSSKKLRNGLGTVASRLCLGKNRGHHLTRYYMYQRLGESCANLFSPEARILSISNSQEILNVIGLSKASPVNACYPDYNILSLPFEDDSFDIVVSDQVIEHIEGDPQKAINETRRVLRKGGMAIHTTCFMNPIHEHPVDLWRFTPFCLAYLHRDWDKIVECAGWGNLLAFLLMNLGLRMTPIPNARWHPLHKIATTNDKAFPIVTWIAVIK